MYNCYDDIIFLIRYKPFRIDRNGRLIVDGGLETRLEEYGYLRHKNTLLVLPLFNIS